MERIPKPNEIYQHFKGKLYRVLTLAKHSETGEMMVVYQALYDDYDVYVRPLDSFVSEVDHEKYSETASKYRFTLIPAVMEQKKTSVCGEPKVQSVTPEDAQCSEATISETVQPTDFEASDREQLEETEEETFEIDPAVMAFLDAETYKEKMDILIDVHDRITDEMINTMSVSLDLEVGEGNMEERYWELKNCLLTLEKYEIERLR